MKVSVAPQGPQGNQLKVSQSLVQTIYTRPTDGCAEYCSNIASADTDGPGSKICSGRTRQDSARFVSYLLTWTITEFEIKLNITNRTV